MIATCKVCGKRIFRPEIRDYEGDGRPALLGWKHRTEKWHYPVAKSPTQLRGQLALFDG